MCIENPAGTEFFFDNLSEGSYDIYEWYPNFGIELALLNTFYLRFGRENESRLKGYQFDSPQYPVSRYGFSAKIPLHGLLGTEKNIFLRFDYCYSDWFDIQKSDPQAYDLQSIDREVWGLEFLWQM